MSAGALPVTRLLPLVGAMMTDATVVTTSGNYKLLPLVGAMMT